MEYVTLHRLGRGSMGVVDLARDEQGRRVALKHLPLHGSLRDMAHARQRIHREVEALRRVDHPHVVRLLDVVERDDEVVLVMPYLEGGTLVDRVRAHGPAPADQVEVLASSLLDALAAAHRHGIVHRDIKPGNVLFDREGRAYLADFGVATLHDATSGLTVAGSVVGTPDFMAPEQARSEPATPASDVFSLGATLLFAATGQPPYGTTDPRLVLQRAARGRLAPLPADLDRGVRRRLAPLLRRKPERRPTAAAAAGGPAGTQVLARPTSRRTRLAVLSGLAAVALVVGAVGATRLLGGSPDLEALVPPITEAPCQDLPYQPCGQQPAPGTDGTACLPGRADYDRDPATGCEAESTGQAGQVFATTISGANLVPGDDVDRYPTPVSQEFNPFCNNSFRVSLVAPSGTAMRLRLLDGDEVLGEEVSEDMRPATVEVTGSLACWFADDATTLTTEVSWVGPARSSQPYRLDRSGSL
jgi:hypothetical protein